MDGPRFTGNLIIEDRKTGPGRQSEVKRVIALFFRHLRNETVCVKVANAVVCLGEVERVHFEK